MSEATIIFFLSICVAILVCVIVYQQFAFRTGTQAKLNGISQKLEEILDTDSDEKVMVFTDNPSLISLATQINRLLVDRQKVRADYRRSELASKRMLSNISHDIKTPMTVILGYLEIMRVSGDPRQEMLGKVESTAHRVMELITQFFTLAKLEAGDTELERSKLNLNEICSENILSFYELLTTQDFQIEVNIPNAPVFVMSNSDALQRILFNLISNAIRYGADGKYLGMVLRSDEENAYIDIIDRGRGIPKEFADTIFDRLFTMEDSRNPRMQGNGLGLTIAKNLAVQLGGDITLTSQPNVKTVFTVTLKKMTY
ncbi:sensor histidine kinase [Pseudoflavonifractor sp. DSM 107456]|uniref:histidine kinase n=1 Tax=Pseudoflavonifractor gallinarum TaxID=2779352 RepID=A0ABR9REP6_9FIRM|nr:MULTISPECIES: sensor histidine kinase [Eubacteriales]MBE5057125.1 sensor histidine kinase [Pseudoflavonifractor gallinarum]